MEELKAAAESEMRRPAPPLLDINVQPASKRQKLAEDKDVERYSYAASDLVLKQGCTCFLATCGFRREKSATKESMQLLQQHLSTGTKLQLVKVGCCGLVVIRAEGDSPVDTVAVVGRLLQGVEDGSIKRTKHCQRLLPAQTTCAFQAGALRAAAAALCDQYVAANRTGGEVAEQGPLTFACVYKLRGPEPRAAAGSGVAAEAGAGVSDSPEAGGACNSGAAGAGGGMPAVAGTPAAEAAEEVGAPLDRSKTLELLAEAMVTACAGVGGAKVDLKAPQVVIFAEVVPVARQLQALALALVPASMVSIRSKLNIKVLGEAEGQGSANDRGKGGL